MIDITEHEFSEFEKDVALGMVSFGIPELYHMYEAIYYGDEEALAYHLKVAGMVHGLWYTGYKLASMWELYRHGRTIMPFHEALSGKGTLMGRAIKLSAPVVLAVASASAQSKVWSHIGDPKTGATHYAGAGSMSGGSMPVVPSHNQWWNDWEMPW